MALEFPKLFFMNFAAGMAWAQFFRKIFALFFFCLCLAAAAEEPKPPDYFLRSWNTENGLPDNAVTAVVQVHDGYLWLGTYGGLVQFDGVRFTVFNSASVPGLQSDRVTSVYEDGQETLWIGHERGDLTRYRDGKFESIPVHETGVRRKISAIGADKDGDIWMLNEEGTLVRARDGATCALPNTDGVAEMAQDGTGKLWVMSGGQLAVLENGQLMTLSNTNDSNGVGTYVQGICASRDGGLWIVSDGQVRKWNGHAMSENRGTNPCNATVVVMLETKSGALAMGTSNDGLCLLFSNRAVLHFDHANGFPNDWIRCLQEDREGTLWVGAGNVGLVALRPGNIETLDAPDHWQGRVPLSIAAARDGAMWVEVRAQVFIGFWPVNGSVTARMMDFQIHMFGASLKIRKAECGLALGAAECSCSKTAASSLRPAWKISMFRCPRFCSRPTA